MLKFTNEQLEAIEDLLIGTERSFEDVMRMSIKEVYENLAERENIHWCDWCKMWYQWDEVSSEHGLCYDCLNTWETDN